MNAGDAVTNQTVSVCRLSSDNRSAIIMAMEIVDRMANQVHLDKTMPAQDAQWKELLNQLKESNEIWLIESK